MPRLPFVTVLPIPLIALVVACDDGEGPGSLTPGLSPALERTPHAAVPPDSVNEFLDQYADDLIVQAACEFDAPSGLVDCGENGLFAPDPAPQEDAACDVLLVDEEPIAVTCESQEPPTITYYAVTS